MTATLKRTGRKPSDLITSKECELMFNYWLDNGHNLNDTGRTFRRTWKAVKRIAVRDCWEKKAKSIETKRINNLAKAKAQTEVTDIKIVETGIRKLARTLLDDKSKIVPRWSDLIGMLRIKLELTGDLKGAGTGDHITNIVNDLSGIERLLEGIDRTGRRDHSRFRQEVPTIREGLVGVSDQ